MWKCQKCGFALLLVIGFASCDDAAPTPKAPPLQAVPVHQANAADHYIRALDIVRARTKKAIGDLRRTTAEGWDSALSGERRTVTGCAPAIRLLVEGAKHETCEWPDIPVEERVERFSMAFLDTVYVALLTAERDLVAGKDAVAAEVFDGLLRFVVRLPAEEGASQFSFRMVIHDWVFRLLEETESSPTFWGRVSETLAWAEPRGFLTRMIEADFQRSVRTFESPQPKLAHNLGPEHDFPQEVLEWSVDGQRVIERLRKPFEEWIRRSRLPYVEFQALPAVDLPGEVDFQRLYDDLKQRAKEGNLPPPEEGGRIISDMVADMIIAVISPSMENLPLLTAVDACDMRAALILIELRKRSGAYPADLRGIRSEWTIDPFSGQPFVYRKEADGILLYSVGQNLEDDGGDEGRTRRSGLDVVYRLKNR